VDAMELKNVLVSLSQLAVAVANSHSSNKPLKYL